MRPADLIRLILSNLNRLRFRAAFSAVGVVIGTMAVVVLVALGIGLQESAMADITGSLGSLNEITVLPGAALQAFGGTGSLSLDQESLTLDFLEEMRRRPDVKAITPRDSLSGALSLGQLQMQASLTGVDPRAIPGLGWEVEKGVLALGRGQALLGAKTLDSFVDTRRREKAAMTPEQLVGQTLSLKVTRRGDDGKTEQRIVRLRVAGILAERSGQDDYLVFLPLAESEDLNAWIAGRSINRAREGYEMATIVPRDSQSGLTIEQELLMRGFYAMSARTMMQSLNLIFLMLQAVFGGVGGIALLVAGVGIANTLTMAIYERTREIGLMKALGATNRDVMMIFLGEAGVIGTLGGALGAILGGLLSLLINVLYGVYLQSQGAAPASDASAVITAVPVWLPFAAVLFATVIGVVSGLYPAQRAARLEPVVALKYE